MSNRTRNTRRLVEAHNVRRERGDELRYRAVFDPSKPVAQVAPVRRLRDLRYWLSLPRVADLPVPMVGEGAARRADGSATHGAPLPPTSNTGGKCQRTGLDALEVPDYLRPIELVLDDGQVKIVQTRAHGWGDDLAHVDQLTFTVHEETCHVIAGHRMVADDDFIATMSLKLLHIFGFGVASKRPKGMNFYRDTWVLGQDDVCYGNLSFGGQRNTICVQLTAVGCMAANSGWEQRLHDFLQLEAINPRLTRVDVAYDDFEGEYNADQMYADVQAGLFNCGGRNPFVEKRSDWDNPDGSGRTLYIGKRQNGKFCRGYEKGREQGSKSSEWFRVEVEFKSVDRIIPLDILLNAGSYLAGAYPAFQRFRGKKAPERIQTIMKEAEFAFDHYLHYAALQVGRLVNYMRDVANWSEEAIVKSLARPGVGFPQRLKLANISADLGNRSFVHDYAHVDYDMDEFARPQSEPEQIELPTTREGWKEFCRANKTTLFDLGVSGI
ncbi:replication initiation factor domain-containing protein [Pseudogulbenkiania ferrooxidans]|uniref:replication initiation factor domain-containing protein n=1 Tax=Pseudogulbenkiania ferrooxidans TaxID=549169 RepID=UPI0003F89FC0|nr:replication initiation factor domain-containing protein [Pseudogulbenkiania ferrooxidans]